MASALLSSRHSSAFGLPSFTTSPASSCSSSSSVSFDPLSRIRSSGVGGSLRTGSFRAVGEIRRSPDIGGVSLPSLRKTLVSRRKCSSERWTKDSLEVEISRGGALRAFTQGGGISEGRDKGESRRLVLPILGELPFGVPDLSEVTPKKAAIWLAIGAAVYSILSLIASRTIFNPKLWTYVSWIFVVWPWPAAVLVGMATLITAYRQNQTKRQPKEWEQVLLLLGSLVWLILVPLGHFHGFVDGWPLLLFSLYTGFFLISAVVRYRLYGDLTAKSEDKQWETTPSRLWQVGFVASVVGSHWLAAMESPFLQYSWNFDWRSKLAAAVLALAVLTHYQATYFLGKYFDRLVKPRAVVMFGPYRWVRHPIYASYMLLFMGYCLALRSYKSMLLIFTACIAYYEQRTQLEEDLLVETFGDLYRTYRERVQNKYFPFLY